LYSSIFRDIDKTIKDIPEALVQGKEREYISWFMYSFWVCHSKEWEPNQLLLIGNVIELSVVLLNSDIVSFENSQFMHHGTNLPNKLS
jgi:hypothetical protein